MQCVKDLSPQVTSLTDPLTDRLLAHLAADIAAVSTTVNTELTPKSKNVISGLSMSFLHCEYSKEKIMDETRSGCQIHRTRANSSLILVFIVTITLWLKLI